jgi:hypothetical protein
MYLVHHGMIRVHTVSYLVYTDHIPQCYCITGFRAALRDVPGFQQPSADPGSDEGDYNGPCPEDEELFETRPDAETMEEAISNFMDGMEAQERGGFKDLHRFLGRLPVPTAKEMEGMTHTEALEGGFLPEMDEDQQNRFTPTELKLYKHALEYRYI